jgi:hypothetical protein
MLDFLWSQLPTYEGITPLKFAMYGIAGVFGALVRVAWMDKPIRGFYRDPDTKGLRMGFYAEIIVGIGVAIMVDGNPIRAGIAAVFAPWILEAMKVVIVEKLPEMAKAAAESVLNKPK